MSETVTQLLDRYDDDLMELARLSTQGMFDKDLYASASEARQQIVDLVAAARREVETVTRERDGWETRCGQMTRERDELRDALALFGVRKCRECDGSGVEHVDMSDDGEIERDVCEACKGDGWECANVAELASDLAASRAALADAQDDLAAVREVEAWIQRGNSLVRPQHYVAGLAAGRLGAFAGGDTADASARSIPALGRALAQDNTNQPE